MSNLLLTMIFVAVAFAWWNTARGAAERAEEVGRDACQAAGVQWLDQTVHANGLRLSRGANGWLGFERSFRFEYSEGGSDRHVGRLVLRGRQLVAFSGPLRESSTTVLH